MRVKRGQDRRGRGLAGMIGSMLLMMAAILFFTLFSVQFGERTTAGVSQLSRRTEEEGARNLVQAVRRASVQCYAIEGRYPPSIEYLEEHYGVMINRKKYNVFYDGFASNVMPDITVVPVME